MRLPQELAMLVGSFLDPHDLKVCTQLCSSGTEFVANLFANDATTILLHELVACSRWSPGVDDFAQACTKRIESFVARHINVRTVILAARLWHEHAAKASVYSDIHRRLQLGSSFQLSQNQGVVVEWHVRAESIAQVVFLLEVDVPQGGGRVSHSSAGGVQRQYLHTLDLYNAQVSELCGVALFTSLHKLDLARTQVRDVSPLASCQSLHTLNLSYCGVNDVSPLASCQSLHTLILSSTHVSDVSPLASCQSLHTLVLQRTEVSDVSPLASCQSLHTLNLSYCGVNDVSPLVLCQSLHTLNLKSTQVNDVSVLASCTSLHTLDLQETQVSDVSALASCQSLHTLNLKKTKVFDVSVFASSQSVREVVGQCGSFY
jgi:hypothetical protein